MSSLTSLTVTNATLSLSNGETNDVFTFTSGGVGTGNPNGFYTGYRFPVNSLNSNGTFNQTFSSWTLVDCKFYTSIEGPVLATLVSANSGPMYVEFLTTSPSITANFTSSGVFDEFPIVSPAKNTACLLKGTLVKIPTGYKPIEQFKTGDTVLTHLNETATVTQVGQWAHNFSEENPLAKMYKIPRGKLGAKTDTYLSKGHRILTKHSNLVLPAKLGFALANKEEFCDSQGDYTLYHLRVDRGDNIVINGSCVVESWK